MAFSIEPLAQLQQTKKWPSPPKSPPKGALVRHKDSRKVGIAHSTSPGVTIIVTWLNGDCEFTPILSLEVIADRIQEPIDDV